MTTMKSKPSTAAARMIVLLLLVLQVAAGEATLGGEDFVPLDKWLQQRDLRSCMSSTPVDLLFIADGSLSVGSANFHLMIKGALVDTISKFRIGTDYAQVGVLVFSNQISQVIPIGRYSNKIQLLSAVSNLRYADSYSSMEAAVEGCAAELHRRFNELNVTHQMPEINRRKTIVVFMTDSWDDAKTSFYLRDLVAQLHSRVSGVLVLEQQRSNPRMVQQLASPPKMAFNPTTYPEFQAALLNLMNSHCADTCHKYEQQMVQAQHGVSVTVRYLNTITENYMQLLQQQNSLIEYVHQVNASANFADEELRRTCDREDNDLLVKIIDVRKQLEEKQNETEFNGMTLDAFESEILRTISTMQAEHFEYSRQLTIEKARRESLEMQEQSMRSEYEARLNSKITIRETNEATLKALEERILEQQTQVEKMEQIIESSRNTTELLSEKLTEHEETYSIRLEVLSKLSKEHTSLLTIKNGGGLKLVEMNEEIAFCDSYLRNGETVLFAIKCGTGAPFASIFSLQQSTFSKEAFKGLTSSRALYKSTYMRFLRTMGYFKDASLQFLVDGSVVATLTMDTSRFELANIFSRFHVTSSFPYVASYINSVYRSSLSQFRLRHNTEFLMILGDLTKYLETERCEDLRGVFLVLNGPHRCYPEARNFPQVYISVSPYGGRMTLECSEFRIVTSQLPQAKQLPSISMTDEKFIDETLLFVRGGAGILSPMLLSDAATSASVLLEVNNMFELARHYKSPTLNSLDIKEFTQVEVEVYNAEKVVARLLFKGPFEERHNVSEDTKYNVWRWFQAKYLESAEPFDVRKMKAARFEMYDGKEIMSIGLNMAADCEQREYFLTIVDGASPCQCFGNVSTPAVFFSSGARPEKCQHMQQASSMRIVGRLPLMSGLSNDQ